jgi:hypothetical protein
MNVKDLINQWEEALAEAQLPVSQELDDAELGAAAVPGVVARSGLMAAGSDPCKDQYVTYFLTCLATC